MIFYEINADSAMIGRVVVLPEYRGKGLGKRVVEKAESWLCDLGYQKAVIESRDVAVTFYEKLGYTVTDETVIHGDTFDCIRMEKSLRDTEDLSKDHASLQETSKQRLRTILKEEPNNE